MRSYLDLMDDILTRGRKRETPRNGSYTLGIFGDQLRFDLSEGFPLVTTRKVPIRGIIEELLWFLSGSTNNEDLVAKKVHIWDQWAVPEDTLTQKRVQTRRYTYEEHLVLKGDIGPIYGKMWRAWPNSDGSIIDQIQILLDNLKNRPYSRRHVISAWNPSVLPDETKSPIDNVLEGKQALAACHTIFQFSVEPLTLKERIALYEKHPLKDVCPPGGWTGDFNVYCDSLGIPKDRLSCKLFARSQDVPVGTVFNIASYAALVLMLCKQLNFAPGDYIHSMGDAHIYSDQIDFVREQLKRQPKPRPTLKIRDGVSSLFDYQYSDFQLIGYDPHPVINYPITI